MPDFGGLRGCWGAAAGADVPPNCRSHHAETILLNHFKASAIGVTARLNQLQNASAVSIRHCRTGSAALHALRKRGEKVLKGDYPTSKSAACAQRAFDVKLRE